MTHTIGYAGGGGPVLQPRTGSSARSAGGSFAVELGPVLRWSLRRDVPDVLMLGLLTRPPTMDGDGFVELAAEGYARQRLVLEQPSWKARRNLTTLAFELAAGDAARASHAGIFDEGGSLLYSGALIPTNLGGAVVRFEAAAIRVRDA